MKKILLGLAMGVMLALIACNNAPSTATFSELSKDSEGNIYYGNALFNGTATSSDGDFLKMEIKDGKIVVIQAKHNNGTIAMTTTLENGYFAVFNEDGEQISEDEYYTEYHIIQDKIEDSISELKVK